eukprot:CAMPEP_0195515746 /NCGR_PEP_ID=MMETSP0794_2-20130614/6709_1 /TAXON_ID=515487 /ORGANISM="Stephanopyxis turris, Strain CCMP 815" /LENGTH=72 /DNA_ID=CAMNT_0040644221 /DNA_START=516 /DNA_END=731 /DNA_ORIENTATION=-
MGLTVGLLVTTTMGLTVGNFVMGFSNESEKQLVQQSHRISGGLGGLPQSDSRVLKGIVQSVKGTVPKKLFFW